MNKRALIYSQLYPFSENKTFYQHPVKLGHFAQRPLFIFIFFSVLLLSYQCVMCDNEYGTTIHFLLE